MNDYQLVLDAEALLDRLKIPAIRAAYPSCRLYPAILRAYCRYARRFYVHYLTVPSFPADAGRSPDQSAVIGQGGN